MNKSLIKIEIKEVEENDETFQKLVTEMNDYFATIISKEENDLYNQFTHPTSLELCLVAYYNSEPIAIGAYKKHSNDTIEIVNFFTTEKYRNKGVSKQICNYLESHAYNKGYRKSVLETAKSMQSINPTVLIYEKLGYKIIPNFPPYNKEIYLKFSINMGKELTKK